MFADRRIFTRSQSCWDRFMIRCVFAALLALGQQACHSSSGSKVVRDANAPETADSGQDSNQAADGLGSGGVMGADSAGGVEAGSAGGSSGSGGVTAVTDAAFGSGGFTGAGGDLGGAGGLPEPDGRLGVLDLGTGPAEDVAEETQSDEAGTRIGDGAWPGIDSSDGALDGDPMLSEVGSDGSDSRSDGGLTMDSRDSATVDRSADHPDDRSDSAMKDGDASEAGAIDGFSVDGGSYPCCGCLCGDPSWSCSNDTWVDSAGHAVAVAPEAGFLELAGGDYVSESLARVSPMQRVWYSFHPATVAPESKPLAVFFNGGPGSATSAYLFSFNTAPYTLDPTRIGSGQLVSNPSSWAQFANLLHIDAPGTGFSYPMSLDGGSQPSVGIDLDRDAASVLRVLVRFLDRHPSLQGNPVILVGESYGGTRAALMLDHLFNYPLLTTTSAAYQDSALYNDLMAHFRQVFPQDNPATLSAAKIASQFGHQVLIQPVVAGSAQWDLNAPDASVCPLAQYDNYQCDQPSGWFDQNALLAVTHLTTLTTLHQALGVDPTTIAWMHASARTRAYGRSNGTIVSTPEMTTTFGTLGTDDNYFVILNQSVLSGYGTGSRWWTDSTLGVSFLNDLVYVNTFITNANYDMVVWTPAIAPALGSYASLVSTSVLDSASRSGVDRPGWIEVNFVHGVIPEPTSREIRLPKYPTAGHTVTARAPDQLLADVMQWYSSTLGSPSAGSGQTPSPGAARLAPPTLRISTAASSESHPFLGP